MKTLIVDDQFENRKLLRDIMKPFGEYDMVSDGQQALELFEADLLDGHPFDLVLLDIMMPGMDGQMVLERIRAMEREYQVPSNAEAAVFMVSALDSPRAVMEAYFKGGCTDYLTKPVTRQALLDKLIDNGLIEG
ncbi:MAG: response regulator [Magnetococcales bacterium]|nr:response regulator [Magnetococcales bacterium]